MAQAEPGNQSKLPRRYIAMRHRLTVEASEDHLQSVCGSTRALRGKLDCEMTGSGLRKKLDKLFEHAGKAGVIVQHSSDSEDKTAAVIDTEAELRNQTSYRDRLRTMPAKPSATFKDLLV